MAVSPIFLAVVALPVMTVALARPQASEPPVPVMRAEARVVEVDVVVTDANGKPVTGLSKDEFKLSDNGKPRNIDIFSLNPGQSPISETPLATSPANPPDVFSNRNAPPAPVPWHSTMIVLDASPARPLNEIGAFAAAKGQAMGRIMIMRPDEQIAILVVAKQAGIFVLQDYTNDRQLLMRKLRDYTPLGLQIELSPWAKPEPLSTEYTESGLPTAVKEPPPSTTESPRRDPNVIPRRETGGRIDTSVRENRMSLQAVAERLAPLPGRKNVFWATTGFPPLLAHGPDWDHTIAALNDANISLSSGGCSNSLREITAKTGGVPTCLEGPRAGDVIEAARMTYTLGFYLPENERNETDHSLRVTVDRPRVQLFYRQSYFAGNTPNALREKKPELASALLTSADSAAVGITAKIEVVPGNPRSTAVLHLSLDPSTLSLSATGDKWTGKVDELFVEMNEQGDVLAKISDTKEFVVSTAIRADYDTHGASWPMSIPLAPGATKVRIAVRDAKTGYLGSLTVPLP